MRVHTSDGQSFKCGFNNCEFETKHQTSLKIHEVIYKNKHDFKCDQNGCEKTFVNKSALRNQQRYVHNQVGHRCLWPGCQVPFKSVHTLMEHRIKVHENILKFKCNYCHKSYAIEKHLIRYKRERHEDLDPTPKSKCKDRYVGQPSFVVFERTLNSLQIIQFLIIFILNFIININ